MVSSLTTNELELTEIVFCCYCTADDWFCMLLYFDACMEETIDCPWTELGYDEISFVLMLSEVPPLTAVLADRLEVNWFVG